MIVELGHDGLVATYVNDRIGNDITGGAPFVGLAICENDRTFVAGVVITNYNGFSCEASIAAETSNWARKPILKYLANYVFGKLGCTRCTVIIRKHRSTLRARGLASRLGFALEGTLKRAYDGTDDALIYGLLAENCRFLGGLNGQVKRTEGPTGTRSLRNSGRSDTIQ